MHVLDEEILAHFNEDIRLLFYRRTLVCLWLGVVFFSLFSILDYVCCRDQFTLFVTYRLIFVVILFCFLSMLRLPVFQGAAPLLMYASMLLGTLTISLMATRLGGFSSGYYVGILLMIAGGFSVLPLRLYEAFFTGISMYLVYVATIVLDVTEIDDSALIYGVNNTFFFLSIVGVTSAQCVDDLRTHRKEIRVKKSLQDLLQQLGKHTGGLEELIEQRLAELQETDLKYRDLYDSIIDLVMLIDSNGFIHKINQHSKTMLGRAPEDLEGSNLEDLLMTERENESMLPEIIGTLDSDGEIRGMQLCLLHTVQRAIEVELNASRVDMEKNRLYQLIFRDISATKTMERQIIDSEWLTGTSRQAAIFGLAKLTECRDDDTGSHLIRIREYTRILAEELAESSEYQDIINDHFIEDMLRSSVLHDIGKVGIPDAILLKPDRLTEEEFSQMKHHCRFGSDTLLKAETGAEEISFLHMGQEIARYHHERWNGKGYPEGLVGEAIPLTARIISLADVYDALTSSRVYKPAYSHEVAKEIIVQESGEQFDPSVVNAFLRREHDFRESRMRFLLQE